MAELVTLITIAQNVYQHLQSVYQLSQSGLLKDMQDCQINLEKVNKSVFFIKNMLLDADAKPELSNAERAWVEELTEVLYEADDLFDEVITTAKVAELNDGAKLYEKVFDKVTRFFSLNNCILRSFNTSEEIKSIQQKLDVIAQDHARYEFKIDPKATLSRRDTGSYLDETRENIIGRENDVKVVVDMLLDPNVEETVGFVVVVGIGGLGKTTLARLVYNHHRVETKFEKKLWVCVSDQDGKGLDVRAILGNIVESSTNKKPSDISTVQSLEIKLQEELKNKTYLLILDDVWTEDPNEWAELRRYLPIGRRGSRVIITTRSGKTAEVVSRKATNSKIYMLKGLSDDDSWRLFMLTAFEREADQAHNPDLTRIGKLIVKKCSNVPLAIKVLGTLLYGQTYKWESFEKSRLPQIETSWNSIMPILKLSYNNLEPSVKNCFRYCALFPKDTKMEKRVLISLWMAQGYIGDSDDSFLILLKRCFFQDLEKDELGDVVSFKMHDLMHDLAQEVAGDEIIMANSPPNDLRKNIRHLFLLEGEWTKSSFHDRNIRTCYTFTRIHSDLVYSLVANWRYLRSLRLYVPDAENLPESIGELLHLRYLNISRNENLKTLPNSIAKLYNLQSLDMHHCYGLKEWPKYFCKLVNLRLLDILGCSKLTCMPLAIHKLINLRDLTHFIVGGMSLVGNQFGGELKDLKFLVNLRGKLLIRIYENLASDRENESESGYLEPLENLKVVLIYFHEKTRETDNETLIAKLQPNRNLSQFWLNGYNGTEIPRWGRSQDDWAVILSNLVKVELECCERLHGIPLLSNLKHLKFLSLDNLNDLEYMEPNAISHGSSRSTDLPFFVSLEYLSICELKRLKGWWGGVGECDSSGLPPFPRLSRLIINSCPELIYLPPCPALESLTVKCSNKSLRIFPGEGSPNLEYLKLSVDEIDNVGYLKTLPACRLTHIKIEGDHEVKWLWVVEEVFKSSSSSLRSLEISGCTRLMSVSGALEHLTALESLSLINIPIVEDYSNGISWRSLRHSLRSLKLKQLHTLQSLPIGMEHLTSLENLSISYCTSLKGLPEWISSLSSLRSLLIESCFYFKSLGTIQNISSLQKLEIWSSPHLKAACQNQSGTERLKIRHIPYISMSNG